MRESGDQLNQNFSSYVFLKFKNIKIIKLCLFMLLNILITGKILYADPPTINSIVNEIQQSHDSVVSAEGVIEIIHDISASTENAAALIPAYDEKYSFKYTKPDVIEMSKYSAVGYFHTTTTIKVNYNSMQTKLVFGKQIKEANTDVPVWLANIINMKEKFSEIFNYADVVIDRAYHNSESETFYVYKITPNNSYQGRKVSTRQVFVDINYTRKRIEKIEGYVFDFKDKTDETKFAVTLDYSVPDALTINAEFPEYKTKINYAFYNIAVNGTAPGNIQTKSHLAGNDTPTTIETSFYNKINSDIEAICVKFTGEKNGLGQACSLTYMHIGSIMPMIHKFIPDLCARLKDKSKNDLYRMIIASEIMLLSEDPRIVGALQEVMKDGSDKLSVRMACIQALSMKGSAESFSSFVSMWNSTCKTCQESRGVLTAIADGLGSIGNRREMQRKYLEMSALPHYQQQGADFNLLKLPRQLNAAEELSVEKIIADGLKNGFWEVRHVSARSFGRRMNKNNIPALITAFQNEDSYVTQSTDLPLSVEQHEVIRMQILDSLYLMNEPSVIPQIIGWLNDVQISNSTHVRLKLIEVLGDLKATEAYETILNQLGSQDELVAAFAGRALAKIGNAAAINPIQSRLSSLTDEYCVTHMKSSLVILRGW